MKSHYPIIILFIALVFAQNIQAQTETTPTTPRERRTQNAAQKESSLPELTPRAQSKNQDQTQNIDNVVWSREIYRQIDLTKPKNSALYYPAQPIGDRMNLFTTIFKLMCENKIKAYEYLDGREIFTDKHLVNFENVLKTSQVMYTTEKRGTQTFFKVEDSDIPSSEVTIYMIKESWYFNQATGTFDKKILAICPMLVREEFDLGNEKTRTPLFWIPYENIRPYISRSLVMTSDLNNALTYTIDDYFRKGMYEGDIFKTTNMMNKSLAQQVGPEPEKLKLAQDSIEAQLKFFEEKLWVPKDTTAVAGKSKAKPEKTAEKKEDKKESESKPKETKPDKSSSSPTKSVRRTR